MDRDKCWQCPCTVPGTTCLAGKHSSYGPSAPFHGNVPRTFLMGWWMHQLEPNWVCPSLCYLQTRWILIGHSVWALTRRMCGPKHVCSIPSAMSVLMTTWDCPYAPELDGVFWPWVVWLGVMKLVSMSAKLHTLACGAFPRPRSHPWDVSQYELPGILMSLPFPHLSVCVVAVLQFAYCTF